MQEKEQDRIKERQDIKVKIKEVINAKPLFKVYEEKYKQEVEMPQLELKKK
jgi:hypothetical protein